jgi:hypothetical protein
MVHGDPRPETSWRWRNAYGRAKRAAEALVRAEGRRCRKPAYTFRLGHVYGPFQNISAKIQQQIASDSVVLPDKETASNVVFTVTIVDAIRAVLAGREQPGEYDLTNVPQWTWREVYQYTGFSCGMQFKARTMPGGLRQTVAARVSSRLSGALRGITSMGFVRQAANSLLSVAPTSVGLRVQAYWYRLRAGTEIAALVEQALPAPEMYWVPMDIKTLRSLQPTERLLVDKPYDRIANGGGRRWPRDLGFATVEPFAAAVPEQ